jgi:hypothetical protein
MLAHASTIVAVTSILVAFAGLIFGVTGRSDAWRAAGLRIVGDAMSVAGFVLAAGGALGGEVSSVFAGLLLLLFASGDRVQAKRP